MPKGYWIGRVDVKSDEGYKPYAMGNAGHLQEIRRPLRDPGGQVRVRGRQRALAQCRDRVSRLRQRRWPATIRPNIRQNMKLRLPHSTADIVVVEGYDGPQP